ncbi:MULTISPECIES: MBL fold metallo-hydrolase [unclassified Sporosarcina]|uniref:MBL fold metallo-hydrolase n=1 Tax=unclassified Sporosarcina TaxID=2647733 RepID=UPI00203AC15F|nr:MULTISPECIES: MBL fold metallo-hydrolase [unclassified Sporosarcina]GKV67118.1 MBL fold hydrolase [Sporosarcina sp. NCCP-2331]GLB57448.1 MBL fold hydrolase [Sporosarcina sp. NCCP-2378]
MLMKKSASEGKIGDVRFMNGVVSFQGVKLNVYSFETDGVLIDTGAQSLLKQFKSFFEKADIDQVVITHSHEDHTGGAGYLQKTFGLPVYMDKKHIAECAGKAKYPFYRKAFWGSRKPFTALPFGKTFMSRQAEWKIIDTPGHAADHLAFLNTETGQLFSGDLYVNPKTKLVLREEHIPDIIRSIETVLAHDYEEMFCCHAGYVKDGRKAMEKKLEYLIGLREQTLDLHGQGFDEKEIKNRLLPNKYPITKFSSGEWDSIHMIRSILAEA